MLYILQDFWEGVVVNNEKLLYKRRHPMRQLLKESWNIREKILIRRNKRNKKWAKWKCFQWLWFLECWDFQQPFLLVVQMYKTVSLEIFQKFREILVHIEICYQLLDQMPMKWARILKGISNLRLIKWSLRTLESSILTGDGRMLLSLMSSPLTSVSISSFFLINLR